MKVAGYYFRALVAGLSGVTALVSSRVYARVLPSGYVLPAVTFWENGAGWSGPGLQNRGFVTRCWAEQIDDAYTLFEALRSGLMDEDEADGAQQLSATVGGVSSWIVVRQVGPEVVVTDQETGAHSVQCEWEVTLEL